MYYCFFTYRDFEGSGQYTLNSALSFIRHGHQVKVFVIEKKTNYDWVIQIKVSYIKKFLFKVVRKVENYFNLYKKEFEFLDRGRYLINSTFDINFFIGSDKPDVIIVNWLSEFISIDVVKSYCFEKSIKFWIWPIDKSFFFGGCHFNLTCNRFIDNCFPCPAVPFYDRKRVMKKRISNSSIIKNSFLVVFNFWFKNYIKENISLNHNKFLFYYDESQFQLLESKTKFRNSHEIHLVYGATQIENRRKGFKYLLNILSLLDYDLDYVLTKVFIHFIGNVSYDFNFKNINVIKHGYTQFSEMIEILKITDVVISTTMDDIGPSFLVTAIEFGNVPVSFDVGIAKDLIIHNKSGFLINKFDHIAFKDVLLQLILKPSNLDYYNKEGYENLSLYLNQLSRLKEIPR